mgnify:CR=1 FL=1
MNILDIILLVCFIPAIISGLRKGFIAQVVAIISIVLGVWLSVKFATLVGNWISQWIEASPQLINIISFAIIFIAVAVVLFTIGKLIEATIKIIMLGWLNKLLGVLFSMLKCILIIGFLIIVFEAINDTFGLVPESYLSDSLLYTPFRDIADSVFPLFKELLSK